jgi:hypothetical protein
LNSALIIWKRDSCSYRFAGLYKIQQKYIAQKYYALQLATYADTKLYLLIVLQYRLRVALKSGSLETKFVGGATNIFILKVGDEVV